MKSVLYGSWRSHAGCWKSWPLRLDSYALVFQHMLGRASISSRICYTPGLVLVSMVNLLDMKKKLLRFSSDDRLLLQQQLWIDLDLSRPLISSWSARQFCIVAMDLDLSVLWIRSKLGFINKPNAVRVSPRFDSWPARPTVLLVGLCSAKEGQSVSWAGLSCSLTSNCG